MIWTCGSFSCFRPSRCPQAGPLPSLSPSLAEKLGVSSFFRIRAGGRATVLFSASRPRFWTRREERKLRPNHVAQPPGHPHLQQGGLRPSWAPPPTAGRPPALQDTYNWPEAETRAESKASFTNPSRDCLPLHPGGGPGVSVWALPCPDSTLGPAPPQVLGLCVDTCWGPTRRSQPLKGCEHPQDACLLTACSYLGMHVCLAIPLRLCVNPYPCQAHFRCSVPNEAQLRSV